jgi:hypothetical protein
MGALSNVKLEKTSKILPIFYDYNFLVIIQEVFSMRTQDSVWNYFL